MKKIVPILLILTTCYLMLTTKVSAHSVGQPPFFKINGVYSDFYSAQSTSLDNFELPDDMAKDTYLVNEKIQFEIDTQALQVPEDIIKQTEFTWEFGDGEKASGLKNEHTYKKQGTYIIKIYVKVGKDSQPQILQSTLLHIVPNKEYLVPNPVLRVNDWISKDPTIDVAKVKFGQTLGFDATLSTTTSEIIEYFWDFGDGQTATGPKVTHVYGKDLIVVFPLLRIKDKDGFFADTYVQLNNSDLTQDNALSHPIGSYKEATTNLDKSKMLLPVVIILATFIAIIVGTRVKRKK